MFLVRISLSIKINNLISAIYILALDFSSQACYCSLTVLSPAVYEMHYMSVRVKLKADA
jgi:hypothetical protein